MAQAQAQLHTDKTLTDQEAHTVPHLHLRLQQNKLDQYLLIKTLHSYAGFFLPASFPQFKNIDPDQ